MNTVFGQIKELFEREGENPYLEDIVSQREHALQAAAVAETQGATDSLVIAALLHDIGHLMTASEGHDSEVNIDDRHEELGHRWLSRCFGPEITEPVRLHVEAKRYLCAVEPGYFEQLSSASMHSLALQGGPHSRREVCDFQLNPYHRVAVRLRTFDDRAKTPNLRVPGLDHYRERVESALLTRSPGPK